MMREKHLAKKRIWLTGASSGIGRALAKELAARGANCALTSRNEEELLKLKEELGELPGEIVVVPGDVTDQAAMHSAAEKIARSLGGIDLIIANAGTHVFTRPDRFDSAEYLRLMEVNYGGMLHTIEAALPFLRASEGGQIVGVSSLASYRGLPRAAAYGASKAAMTHFLESLRFHLEKESIKVTVVSPGFVKTPLTDKNDFHMPFLIDAERSARIICDGIEKGRKEISFPIPFNWGLKIMRGIPYPLYEFIVKRFVWKE